MGKIRCRFCKEEAFIRLKQHRLNLCKEHYLSWFENYTQRTIREFNMIKEGERVLVAVSGGKDSLSLWFVLKRLNYQADGLYIDLGIGEYSKRSKEKVLKFAKEHNLKLIVVSLKEEGIPIPLVGEKTNRSYCSLCGRIKRYYFNKVAREGGYDILATGHNLDDEASSLLSNVLSWDLKYLGSKFPVLEEEGGFKKKVKPFFKFSEKEVLIYTLLRKIDFIEEECPYSEGASTLFYKKLLNEVEERSPGTKLRFYLDYLRKVYPLFKKKREDLKSCILCGEPSYKEVCFICSLKGKVKV